tara:strand:+ start:203 stop:1186 length:984 start_codon:yes stop_codon:yes gene_type:complete
MKTDLYKNTKLYPKIKYNKKYLLKVSDIHTIAFFTYGNENGKPVLVVHGGPGAGTTPDMARFFDPKSYFIILVDQRGCGKSKPFGEIKENTTKHLISDFEKVRKKLKIEKWMIFGGSWGSTLSLAYSIEHPECVTEIILRGIFLMRQKEVDWFNEEGGASSVFPETWEIYKDAIPKKERNHFLKAYEKRFNGSLGPKEKENACWAWSIWEDSAAHLYPKSLKEIKKDLGKNKTYIPISVIELHYFKNLGFFPREGYLLEESNIDKIKDIPIVVVQGRYDMVCPITSAYDLHKKIPKAEFFTTMAGHSAFENENIKYLVMATDKYKNK